MAPGPAFWIKVFCIHSNKPSSHPLSFSVCLGFEVLPPLPSRPATTQSAFDRALSCLVSLGLCLCAPVQGPLKRFAVLSFTYLFPVREIHKTFRVELLLLLFICWPGKLHKFDFKWLVYILEIPLLTFCCLEAGPLHSDPHPCLVNTQGYNKSPTRCNWTTTHPHPQFFVEAAVKQFMENNPP